MTNRAPLITAIVLLLLPVLYVGSCFALVVPAGLIAQPNSSIPYVHPTNYRVSGRCPRTVFWPLEQVDRKVRPQQWNRI